jgi:N-hydroxyarylamine O-acetyltransferase
MTCAQQPQRDQTADDGRRHTTARRRGEQSGSGRGIYRDQAMTQAIDLDAYFRRIGHTGAVDPNLDTLSALHLRHAQAIAFENLNPLAEWPVPLDAASLERKLVRDGRGGYCFEQNLLFAHVLKAIGFRVGGLAARVLWNQPGDAVTPRSHMLLLIDLDGEPYVADVGFGVITLTAPLRLELDIEQTTPHEPFRLVRSGDGLKMQSRIGDGWQTLYRFDLQEQLQPDYEVSNYFLSSHPNSLFRTSLLAARPAADRRYALLNNRFAVHHVGGPTERRVLKTVAEVRDTLESAFLLALPESAQLDTAIGRLLEPSLSAPAAIDR